MDGVEGGKTTFQGQHDKNSMVYERPELRELGKVKDLTWEGSNFDVST